MVCSLSFNVADDMNASINRKVVCILKSRMRKISYFLKEMSIFYTHRFWRLHSQTSFTTNGYGVFNLARLPYAKS